MKEGTWLRCHMHAFEYLGGSTPCVVPDNLKTGVKGHPREGEVELNDAYREMAAHYGSAVMPARVRTPRDKPSVENEVWQAATEIVAALRDAVFTDFNELRRAVAAKLEEHNARPFTKREGARREVFEEQERPLPSVCVLSTGFDQNEHRNLSGLRTTRAQAFLSAYPSCMRACLTR